MGCCCGQTKSNRVQDDNQLLSVNFGPSSNNLSKHEYPSSALSSSRSRSRSTSVSSTSSDSSYNYQHHQPQPCTSRKDIIFSLYYYLRGILRQIIGDITSIQVHLCSF